MIFEPLLSLNYIIFFIIIFFISLIVSYSFKIKFLVLRVLTFIIFFIIIINPQIEKKDKDYHKDIVLLVSDLTQSILETKKDKDILLVKKNITDQLNNLKNIEVINTELNNKKEIDKLSEKEIKTSIFKLINRKTNNINLDRLSGIIVITDGQIHDFDNYNKLFSKIPIHFIIVGNKQEKDRVLNLSNVPNYALIGKKYNISLKIADNISKKEVKTTFYLDGKLVDTKSFLPNKTHNINLQPFHLGKNILEIKVEDAPSEISQINNNQVFEINGIQDKLRVMLISGEPNMGLRSLRNILNSDPAIELVHFTILRPPTKRDLTPVKELSLIPFPSQELFAADISKFNLIIFDQYGLQGILPPKYLDNISRFVLSGGALLDIVGKKHLTRDSLINTPIKQILPTSPIENFNSPGFRPKLTKIGERHPITNKILSSFSEEPWGQWYNFTKSSVVSGSALMHYNNYPLLIVDEVGKGRVAQILSNQTWVWQKSLYGKGPLLELLRNTIQWLLKNPKMEENFISFSKKNDLINIKLNSLSAGNINAEVTTPNKEIKNLVLKDNGNGIFKTQFKSSENGKFRFKFNDQIKYFIIEGKNEIEIKEIISTENKIKEFIDKNSLVNNSFNVVWYSNQLPKVVKVYNNKTLSGKNWIGIVEKNISKTGLISKKAFLHWFIIFISLAFLLLYSWHKEGKY